MIRKERIYELTPGRKAEGNVVYWMSREQRAENNPGLLYARYLAEKFNSTLSVVFTLTDDYPGAAIRHYDFMLKGLREVAVILGRKNIPFSILRGNPSDTLLNYSKEYNTGIVIMDFDPLRIKRMWQSEAVRTIPCKFIEVDGHNIVPARFVSDKLEYGAYTLRPKIYRHLRDFLVGFQELKAMSGENRGFSDFSSEAMLDSLKVDRRVQPVGEILPGASEARKVLDTFIKKKLPDYNALRNDPNKGMTSGLSPYLHFGQISSLQIASEVIKCGLQDENSEAFLEELIVRKELSDNFCHYNSDYDNPSGFHAWAKKTHYEHVSDQREYMYSSEQLENAGTHDPLWNAAQMEMVKTGRMHGYLRMYWAKKILEWTESPAIAMEVAIFLNDKYELDGRDPNGYAGIAWSIGGVHDRAWKERPVFGKIRYMNYNGCKRKFDVDAYINKIKIL